MKTDRAVYVVQGTCGEYESRETWPVAVFASAAEARVEVKRLEARLTAAKATAKASGGWPWGQNEDVRHEMVTAGDPRRNGDPLTHVYGEVGDTHYYVLRVRLGPWTPGVPE